jgi:hypothetical protein
MKTLFCPSSRIPTSAESPPSLFTQLRAPAGPAYPALQAQVQVQVQVNIAGFVARWLAMLLRNLGVGIWQCRSQSRRCAVAGVGVQQGCSSNPAPSAGARPANSNAASRPAESNSFRTVVVALNWDMACAV